MRRNEKTLSVIAGFCVMLTLTACGSKEASESSLEGSLNTILDSVYQNADLPDDFREGLEFFETYEITEDLEYSVFGTDEITYTEGVVSMPMQTSIAYQCVLLRVEEDNVDTVKQQIKDNANLDKWVCVSAETMLVESRGDVIFFVMGEEDEVYALNTAFQNL